MRVIGFPKGFRFSRLSIFRRVLFSNSKSPGFPSGSRLLPKRVLVFQEDPGFQRGSWFLEEGPGFEGSPGFKGVWFSKRIPVFQEVPVSQEASGFSRGSRSFKRVLVFNQEGPMFSKTKRDTVF